MTGPAFDLLAAGCPASSPSLIDILRSFLRRHAHELNPFDVLVVSLQFFAGVELEPAADCVLVNEEEGGFSVVACMSAKDGVCPRIWESPVIEVSILAEPDEWRESTNYRQWRTRGFYPAHPE